MTPHRGCRDIPGMHPTPIRLLNDNKAMVALLGLYQRGQIDPVIAHTFPLAEAAAAYRYLQERRNIGKVLLATDR